MTGMRGGKGIFFAELDDDYQELRRLSGDELLERTVCYFLLAPSLIIHPAYIWQSAMAHGLLHGGARELLRPPFVQLELGNHESILDYMGSRMDRLRSPSQPTRELRAYEAHGMRLFEEARRLDIRFSTASSRNVSASWRDKRFRELLLRDLGATDLDRISLAAQFSQMRSSYGETDKARQLSGLMQRFIRSANLVSVDTFLRRIYDEGFISLESNPSLRSRLLALYYQTYVDDETVIPSTSKLLSGQVVNAYDSEMFWGVMTRLFGHDCRVLAKPTAPELVHAIRSIRDSPDWSAFVSVYFETLSVIDDTLWTQPEEVIRRFDRADPGRSQIFVLRNLWQSRKLDLAAAAFGAIAVAASAVALDAAVGIMGTAAGLISLGTASVSLLTNVRRFTEQYRNQDVVRLKATIKAQVDRALADTLSQAGRPSAGHSGA